MLWSDVHFLRPWWLLLMLLAPGLWFMARRCYQSASPWASVIAPHLLPHVVKSKQSMGAWWQRVSMPLCVVFLSLALAGPTAQKIALDQHYRKAPVIIALELTGDMLKDDIAPNRLKRAVYKISDLLAALKGSEVALLAFAGDAHVVVPLTDDYHTVITLAKSLSPDLMPKAGVDYQALVALANTIAARHVGAKLLVITGPQQAGSLKGNVGAQIPLIVWSFGAPMQVTKDWPMIHASLDQSDVQRVIDALSGVSFNQSGKKYPYDTWLDLGPYFLMAAIALFLTAFFTSQVSLGMLLCILVCPPHQAQAGVAEWFLNSNQRAQKAYKQGDFTQAAELYGDDMSKGAAHYRASAYDEAIKYFSRAKTPDGFYNLGNALAKKGSYQEAIEAYKQALSLDSHHQDAQFNKALLEDLLKKQQEQQPQQQEKPQEKQEQPQEQPQNQQQGDKPDSPNTPSDQQRDQQEGSNQTKGQPSDKEAKPQDQQASPQSKNAPKDQEHAQQQAKPTEQAAKELPNQESLDRKTRYYFDQLEQHNSLYLKRKFRYESEKNQGLKK